MAKKHIISIKMLPGEPLDGSGRACIHLFVQDEQGCFTEPHVVKPMLIDGVQVKQQTTCEPARGRLACDPNRNPAPVVVNGVTIITHRTDDPRAATCPRCLVSQDYANMMKKLEDLLPK